ncbi:hypothetical protein BGW38_009789 [Lunasporangiospora selenospora]|uniref:Uncharacterized protein n=1 Tax=Lunasporangiospora selenospora TaxID=979761 RepID=A0A9P6F525_9FUNG|nr:hypothetical protein BGW38_009789 [Lunasporangiospora selenospora]
MSSPSAVSVVSGAMTLFSAYNTYAYNDHIGGHEFIDRIELPGCRRVLYAILEPDSQKRLTIDQIIGDEWVASICHCTDVLAKQGLQAAMVHGPGASASKYMLTASGQVHHSHFKPKHVGV